MPFWKKSEDPWDIDPSKRRPAPKPAEKAPGLVDTIREEWDAMQKERQEKREKLKLPPEKCPWCGKDMAWYCPACKKMTIDASDLQTEAEKNQMAFPTGAENMTEQSDEIKEGE